MDLENTIMNFHENVRVMYNSFFKLIEEQQFELTSLNNINKYFWLKMGAQDLNKCFILIHRDHGMKFIVWSEKTNYFFFPFDVFDAKNHF